MGEWKNRVGIICLKLGQNLVSGTSLESGAERETSLLIAALALFFPHSLKVRRYYTIQRHLFEQYWGHSVHNLLQISHLLVGLKVLFSVNSYHFHQIEYGLPCWQTSLWSSCGLQGCKDQTLYCRASYTLLRLHCIIYTQMYDTVLGAYIGRCVPDFTVEQDRSFRFLKLESISQALQDAVKSSDRYFFWFFR